jgi:hypothetical protein
MWKKAIREQVKNGGNVDCSLKLRTLFSGVRSSSLFILLSGSLFSSEEIHQTLQLNGTKCDRMRFKFTMEELAEPGQGSPFWRGTNFLHKTSHNILPSITDISFGTKSSLIS